MKYPDEAKLCRATLSTSPSKQTRNYFFLNLRRCRLRVGTHLRLCFLDCIWLFHPFRKVPTGNVAI